MRKFWALPATCYVWTGQNIANKPVTIWQVYSHFFLWIKPANVIQVIGKLLNLPDVGRSQVGFQKNEEFPQVLEVTGQFSAITNCLNIFYIKPSNITQVVGQFDNLPDDGRSQLCFQLSKKLWVLSRFQENFSLNQKLTSDLPTSCRFVTDQWPVFHWQVLPDKKVWINLLDGGTFFTWYKMNSK